MSDLQADDVTQLSGTTVAPVTGLPESLNDHLEPPPLDSTNSSDEEQALESHEVIELQTFSERKVWIEEKIKFLEKMPPVEVFAGLDAVRTSAEYVPGVPTPDELKQWIAEHDVIEKETEIFDRGELTKLRQLTKAAAQRNLSPADTDLIELTLTTIYELDKLLHLLRDRSENLELLTTRLSWEQSRIAAWVDRRTILEDLQTFLDTRVRWTPSAYENVSIRGDETPDLKRRSSIASLASASSDTSSASLGFSRGARFKLAESLSHDAAQFAGRVTSLRHGKITVAGKMLDKLIDQSGKPIPDELLDEQEKLEEQGITEMENLGKFVLNMVVQWRKADEIYVETMMDKTTAQNLFEEIETAKLHHPTARQSASFVSRADALIKRLDSRGNPASSTSTFPSPEHPLFNDQRNSNQMLAQLLSLEIVTTSTIARKAVDAAKVYRITFEAVKHVEDLTFTAKNLSDILSEILTQLQIGIFAAEGDGSPPDLSSITCLELNKHSVFLARFPSILEQVATTAEKSKQVLRHSVPAILGLDHPGVDGEFIRTARSQFEELEVLLNRVEAASEVISARCDRLKEARRLDAVLKETLNSLEDIEHRISTSIKTQRWQRITPLSSQVHSVNPQPLSPLPIGNSHGEFAQELLRIDYHIDRDVDGPFRLLLEALEDPLKLCLSQRYTELKGFLDAIKKQGTVLDSVQRQTAMMKVVFEEFCNIQRDIEVLKNQFETRTREVLGDQLLNGSIPQVDADLQTSLNATQAQVIRYVDRLSDRISFVSQNPAARLDADSPLENNRSVSLDSKFDLPALDNEVRADSNSFAMTLSSHIEDLKRHLARFQLAGIAKEVDFILIPTAALVDRLIEDLVTTKSSLSEVISRSEDITLHLIALSQDVEQALQHNNLHIERSFSQIRDLVQTMDAMSEGKDTFAREALYASRFKLLDNTAALHKTWERDASTFLNEIKQKYTSEIRRRECLSIAEKQSHHAERDRARAEEAGRFLVVQAEDEKKLAGEAAQLEQTRLNGEENPLSKDEEKCLQNENEQEGDDVVKHLPKPKTENFDTEKSRRLQVERLDEEMQDRFEQDDVWFEKVKGAMQENGECCVGKEIRCFEDGQASIQSDNDQRAAGAAPSEKDQTHEQVGQGYDGKTMYEEMHQLPNRAGKGPVASERDYLQTEQQSAANDELENDSEEDCTSMGQDSLSQKRWGNIADKPFDQAFERHSNMAQGQTQDVEIKSRRLDKPPTSRQPNSGPRQTVGKQRNQSPEFHHSLKSIRSTKGSTLSSTSYQTKPRHLFEEDVFGLHVASEDRSKKTEARDLQVQILAFRRRLRCMNINEIARPRKSSSHLPDLNQSKKMARDFSSISSGVALLPCSASDPSIDLELRSLRTELEGSIELIKRVEQLAHLAEDVQKCDAALSDLLEHIDCYPASPNAVLLSSHKILLETTPEEQLSARITFTRGVLETMITNFASVSTDLRAISEKTRVLQTWSELEDMAHDLIDRRKSRPASAISSQHSSGRNSRASNTHARGSKKTTTYSNLIVSSASPHQRLLLPPHPTSRRAISGGTAESQSRPASRLSSLSSNRAVSGPFRPSVYGSTFASRQRTSSLSNSHSMSTPTAVCSRPQTAQHPPVPSPTESDASSSSRLIRSHARSSTSTSVSSGWARAPRDSPSSIGSPVKIITPKKRSEMPRKTYVADPKSKLDMAVGDVVNKLPVGINVEGVAETWKDQSGKYWIGNQDPKLCFCRILRSQTVMVRVGGGWSELSKFIRDHFADSFRLLPESPPRFGTSEEKWISSSTLLEVPAEVATPPVPPRTPEPTSPFVPSFSVSTPNGKSPRSLSNSPSTKGSPLTPLQFIRRADMDSILRPGTPSKPSTTLSPRNAMTKTTPVRTSIWRP